MMKEVYRKGITCSMRVKKVSVTSKKKVAPISNQTKGYIEQDFSVELHFEYLLLFAEFGMSAYCRFQPERYYLALQQCEGQNKEKKFGDIEEFLLSDENVLQVMFFGNQSFSRPRKRHRSGKVMRNFI